MHILLYTVKKGSEFPVFNQYVTYQNSPWPGITKLFPARESLVSDIPAGDGKIDNIFFTMYLPVALFQFEAFIREYSNICQHLVAIVYLLEPK